MARKNILPYEISSQSLASSFSIPTVIKYLDNISYQINIKTTDSVGTFSVQGSLDYAISEPGNQVIAQGNWSTIPLTTASGTPLVASGANDTILVDLNQLPFNAIRLSYAPTTAGTGTVDIYFLAKQVGG